MKNFDDMINAMIAQALQAPEVQAAIDRAAIATAQARLTSQQVFDTQTRLFELQIDVLKLQRERDQLRDHIR
jgi:hypothetical protein